MARGTNRKIGELVRGKERKFRLVISRVRRNRKNILSLVQRESKGGEAVLFFFSVVIFIRKMRRTKAVERGGVRAFVFGI